MPGLTEILRQQTDNYKKSINPEPEANLVTPVITFLSDISIFSTPINHLTGELGRKRAETYCISLEKIDDEQEVVNKLCEDLFSSSSVLADSSKYAKELRLGLLAYYNLQSVSDVRSAIQAEADKAMRLQLKGVNHYGGLPPKNSHLFNAELTVRLLKALPVKMVEKYFPEKMPESKGRHIFEL
ncbi:MAG: hypothetical protein WAW86_07165 [Gammaproteobacteria bacterium]